MSIQVQHYENNNPAQCYSRQYFYYSSLYCRYSSGYVRGSNVYLEKVCLFGETNEPKSVNCNSPLSTYFIKCPTFLRKKNSEHLSRAQTFLSQNLSQSPSNKVSVNPKPKNSMLQSSQVTIL